MNLAVVHHFGPDPATVGGMASVIRVLTESSAGGDVVEFHPTWKPHARLSTARLFAASAWALMKVPAGQIAHIHLSEKGSFVREGALVALARRRGLVTVATIHGGQFTEFASRHPRLVSAVLSRSHLVTCLAQETVDCVLRAAPEVRCEIVPNPIVVDDQFWPADQTDELVVFAGEVRLRKGADVMHRAWLLVAERRPAARCLMVGPAGDFDPPNAERLEVQAPVNHAEMRDIIRRARVIALPAKAEAMPMILTEAMSAGRPFVGTPVGGIPDLAREGGMLVPVDDELALADRLTDLLADPVLACAIGERGRQFCIETRSIAVIDARLQKLYAAAGQRLLRET
jgi:glycosyltransferase involved in cell wall biosynthesis